MTKADMEVAYRGRSRGEAARLLGVSQTAMANQLKRVGLKERSLRQAGKLRYRKIGFELSEDQEQLVYGSLLGDACLYRQTRKAKSGNLFTTYKLWFAQGEAQLEYLKDKTKILPCSKIGRRPDAGSHFGGPMYQAAFSNTIMLREVAKLCHRNHKKKVTSGWLKKLDWRGLAYWYQDDGCLVPTNLMTGWRIQFSTQGFSLAENRLLARLLHKFELTAKVAKSQLSLAGDQQYYLACGKTKEVINFLTKIQSFISPCLHYKLRCLPSFAAARKSS